MAEARKDEAVTADEVGACGDAPEIPVLAIIEMVKDIKRVVVQLDEHSKRVPENWQRNPIVSQSISCMQTVKETLNEFIVFLESPLGRSSLPLVMKNIKWIASFVDIGAQVILASLFVYISQKLLDIEEDDLKPIIYRIELCIGKVRDSIPKIENKIREAKDILKELRDEDDKARNLFSFELVTKEAKDEIEMCKDDLNTINSKINEAMCKINAKLYMFGLFRGTLIGSSSVGLWLLVKKNYITSTRALIFGAAMTCFVLFSSKPRYRQVIKDMKMYREIHDHLLTDVTNFERRIASLEESSLCFIRINNK